MMSHSKNLRRIRAISSRTLQRAIESLEPRTLLSVATISNNPISAPVPGSLILSVDEFGTFGDNFTQSGAVYDSFVPAVGTYSSVTDNELYFQPADAFLSDSGATDVSFTSASVNSVTSKFSVAGFDITLTQTIEPIPSSDSVTDLVQTYQITNVSNSDFDNVPFNVVHLLSADRDGPSISNWGGLSGDQRIAIAFTSLGSDAVFQRIDASGLDASGNSVPDWDAPVGFDVAKEASTSSEDPGYAGTIDSSKGIPTGDNGMVQGDTNGDLLDDNIPPATVPNFAVIAMQDSLKIGIGDTVTYTTTTGWGDTGNQSPAQYRLPGTFDIRAITPSAPEGTEAVVQIFRTAGSFGSAGVEFDDVVLTGTATLNQDYQGVAGDITLADGQTETGPTSFSDNPEILVINDIKIESREFFFVTIASPTNTAKLAPGNPVNVSISIPANDFPSPFHFATTNPGTTDPVTSSWTEGDTATIPVERNGDDGANPNTGPYGNFSVTYTISGSGSHAATPGVDFVDNTPGAVLQNGVYTGLLNFAGVTDPTMIDLPQFQNIQLQVVNDNLFEGPETFTVTLVANNPPLITDPETFTGTIVDAQSTGPVHLQFSSESVDEAAGTKTINVIRSGSTNGQVTVNYAIVGGSASDQATPGVDFTVPGATLNGDIYSGSLIFDLGSSTPETPLVIDLIPTDKAEPNKSMTISLSDPNNLIGVLGTPIVETLTITNNNTPGQIHFVGSGTQTVDEGSDPLTGNPFKIVTLQVTRDPADGAEGAVSVNYSTGDETALAGTDYLSTSGTLSWADGETGPKDIQVEVLDNITDPYPRPDRSFTVNLSDPTDGAALTSPSAVTITIVDTKQAGVNLSDSTYTAYEKDPSTGQAGTANVVVERNLATGQSAGAWSFTYVVIPGTAQANVDYAPPTTTTINVPASDSTYTIQISLLADPNSIADTNFTVRLTSGTIDGVASLGSSTGATVTILNADASVQLSASTFSANPGSGSVPVVITRTSTEQSDVPIIVSYTTADGIAIAGKDYTTTTGSVTIPADQTSVTVNVPILTPINSSQPTKSFTFKITNAVLADPADDANSVALQFSSAPSTIKIAGLVNVTNIQLLPGRANRVAEVVITFSDPLVAAGAQNTGNYILATIGKKGAFNSQVALTNAEYNPTNDTVALFVKTPLALNKLYQLSIRPAGIQSIAGQSFITGAPGGLGGTAIATLSRGARVKYVDPDGDFVALRIKHGGSMDFIDGLNGANPDLTLTGNSTSQLAGVLKAKGDGHAIIDSITNLDGVQDTLLTNPLFSVEHV